MKRDNLLIVISLLISLFIYMFYRTEKTVINELAIRIIDIETFLALREAVKSFLPLNEIVIFSLPEGLWVFCITLTSRPFYLRFSTTQINCLVLPLLYSVGLELFQLLNFTNGRFDFMDIWISIVFWCIANYFFNNGTEKQNVLKPLNIKSLAFFASYGIVYLSHVLS